MAKHAKQGDSGNDLYELEVEDKPLSLQGEAFPGNFQVEAPANPASADTAITPEVPKRKTGLVVSLILLLCALMAAIVGIAMVVMQPVEVEEPTHSDEAIKATVDADLSTKKEEEIYINAHKGHPKVNPIIAQCSGIDLRSPIAPGNLTGVLFHQASYKYALVMTTALPTADLGEVGKTRQSRINWDQYEGEWLDADAMHIWRTADKTPMDTSIDVGAKPETIVRSPVTGTVVLVKDYMLYNELPDIEIHIQPDGRPDLDVVLIHTTDPLVKAGDKVEAGVTEISHVRDIASKLTDVQLGFYTPADDKGNHTHVQVNDANYAGYREQKLAGAITVS